MSNEPRFTPGPWRAEPCQFPRVRGRGCWWNVEADEDFVADCSRTLDPTDAELERDKANAMLIAASPELLAACRAALRLRAIECILLTSGKLDCIERNALRAEGAAIEEQLRAAIAKATT